MTKEVENVLKLDNRKKYMYFIKKIVDWEEVWSLKDEDGWAELGLDGETYFPVWAKEDYSELCRSEEWRNYHSEAIDLYEFMQDWIPRLKKDGMRITIMWYEGAGIDIDWDDLSRDISIELEKY